MLQLYSMFATVFLRTLLYQECMIQFCIWFSKICHRLLLYEICNAYMPYSKLVSSTLEWTLNDFLNCPEQKFNEPKANIYSGGSVQI